MLNIITGWFDSPTFLEWLKEWEKHTRRLGGKRVLVGDNLRTHHSVAAIDLCQQHGVEYVCFPPNSTDKLQPLDVGVYRSLKEKWRQLLRRVGNDQPGVKVMDKSVFPSFLRELVDDLNPKEKLINAFAKCGLYPVDPERPLQSIPDAISSEEIASHIDQQLMKKLEVRRFGDQKKRVSRGPKVPPGKSYCAESSSEEEDEDDKEEEEEDTEDEEEDTEDEVSSSSREDNDVDIDSIVQSLEQVEETEEVPDEPEKQLEELPDPKLLKTGILVAVNYEVPVLPLFIILLHLKFNGSKFDLPF